MRIKQYFNVSVLVFSLLLPSCETEYPLPLDTVTPNRVPTAGGTVVTIYSEGITKTTAVLFGGVAAPDVRFINDVVIQATTPPNPEGAVDVVRRDDRYTPHARAFKPCL